MPMPYWAQSCTDCGKQTTKSYAHKNKGRCKSCVEGVTVKVQDKPENIREEVKYEKPKIEYVKNFKNEKSHWRAEIFKCGLGWSAEVTCVTSENWDVGAKTLHYEIESVEALLEYIRQDLRDRETSGGMLYPINAKGQ